MEQVRVTVLGTSESVEVEIVWAGGHRTGTQIGLDVRKLRNLGFEPEVRLEEGIRRTAEWYLSNRGVTV